MNILWAALVIVAATATSVAAMLAVRRHSPEAGWFSDRDRAAGIFGVIATGFSVLRVLRPLRHRTEHRTAHR